MNKQEANDVPADGDRGRNEIVLVTGATSGIGRAIVAAYSREGARVIGIGRRIERLKTISAAVGARFLPLQVDIRRPNAVEKALADLPDEFKDISILVNNAGLASGLDKAHFAKWRDWEEMIGTNVAGTALVTHVVLPGMVARDRGLIVNIGSVAADTPYAGGNVYGATKAFIRQFSLNLKADLLGTQVRVSCIEPGMVKTEFLDVRFHGDSERAAAMYEGVEYLTAEDIADIVMLVSTLPSRINVNLIQLMPTEQAHAGYAFASTVRLRPQDH